MPTIPYVFQLQPVNRHFRLMVLLCLAPLLLTAQGQERYYGGSGAERALGCLALPGGGFVLTGNIRSNADSLPDAWFLRTDDGGNILTQRRIGQPDRFESANLLLPAADGGFLLAGEQGADVTGVHQALILKTDAGGNVQWTVAPPPDSVVISTGVVAADGGWWLAGVRKDHHGNHALWYGKVGSTGTLSMVHTIALTNPVDAVFGFIALQPDTLWIGGIARDLSSADKDVLLVRIDGTGALLDTIRITRPGIQTSGALGQTANGNILLAGNTQETDCWYATLSPYGTILQQGPVAAPGPCAIRSIQSRPNGGIALAGMVRHASGQPSDGYLLATTPAGSPAFSKTFGGILGDIFNAMVVMPDGGFALAGQTSSYGDGSVNAWFVRSDSIGNTGTRFLNGYVRLDQNLNCLADSTEKILAHWLVRASGSQGMRYALTDSTGFYEIHADTGLWYISVLPPSTYWTPCHDSVALLIDTSSSTWRLDFSIQAQISCPLLDVDLGTTYLRRCADNVYTVRYFNYGTASAHQARIAVVLDPYLTIQSATIPWQQGNQDTIWFAVGDVPVFSGGSFSLTAYLNCDSTVTGQTHCSTAHIFPDSICSGFSPLWDMSNLTVTGQCLGDSILFRVVNTGIGDMAGAVQYIIIEDLIIIKNASLQLAAGHDTTFILYPNGATLVFKVLQTIGNPNSIAPTLAIEGCGGAIQHTGIPAAYPLDDGSPFIDKDCRQNIASLDPNGKMAFPTGTDAQAHNVPPGTELEYLLQFQNTGTDTAFRVEIRDTLSSLLDDATVVGGAASHPYQLLRLDNGALRFVFDPIHLPDSTTNAVTSHGFVRFRVKARQGLPAGVRVENRAGIYFDFNPVLLTNTVWQTLRNPDPPVLVISPAGQAKTNLPRIYSNPMTERAMVCWDGLPAGLLNGYSLELTDLTGRVVWREQTVRNPAIIEKTDQPAGLYLLKISDRTGPAGVLKLIIR
jgi:hypothetical protein